MKLSLLIFALSLVGAAYSAATVERTVVSDAEKEQGFSCKSSNPNLHLMRAGEERNNYIPNSCIKSICDSDGYLTTYTCGVLRGPKECKLVEELFKPYPECCSKTVC